MLADVLEEFCNMCLKCCGLDPCLYLTRSGLSWDTILKMTVLNKYTESCNEDKPSKCTTHKNANNFNG